MIKIKAIATQLAVSGALIGLTAVPMTANAQNVGKWIQQHTKTHRQNSKNNWRNLGYAGAGVAVLGLLTHSPLLTGLGIVGGLYSASRYEHDRRSQNAADHKRYAYFNAKSRTINGHKYRRVTVMRNGHKYYAYKRA